MITAKKIYEVFGITSGPWKMIHRVSIGTNIEWGVDDSITRPICHMRWSDGLKKAVETRINSDAKVISTSSEMLVALVNNAMELDSRLRFSGFQSYDLIIKAIESADRKNRKWPEIKEAFMSKP